MNKLNNIPCILCGKTSELKHDTFPGYQEPQKFEIFHCSSCNTAFSMPRTNDTREIYNVIYHNGANIPGYDRYWKYANEIIKKENPLDYLTNAEDTYWGVKQALTKIVRDKKFTKILEVGSGIGYLTYALNKDGYNVSGIDISDTAVQQAKKNFGDFYISGDVFKFAEGRNNFYDVVILTEVIEHVNEPVAFTETLFKLLKPGGRIVMTTPNKSFYPSDILWDTDNPPIHCWWFGEESIKVIAKKINATVNFIDFSNYYKNLLSKCNIKVLRNNCLRMPVLDKDGLIIRHDVQKKSKKIISVIRKIISFIPFIKRIYKYFFRKFNPDIIFYDQKGYVICAIFEKSESR
jgi:SAM-dependent methyltransferase